MLWALWISVRLATILPAINYRRTPTLIFFVVNLPPGVWPKIGHRAPFFAFQKRRNQKFISYHYP
jgi:hypothetical protein